ncbi:DCP2-domain-containing protein [Meredithblackwellia eburnea MCA 4105]
MPDPPPVNNKRQPHATSFPETLDDLAARFIANMPEKYWDDEVRIMFQIEQAHWYYEDWIRPNVIPSLAHTFHSYSLRQFFIVMLKTCDLLSDMRHRVNEVWDNFMDYKTKVPVCGAVLISHRWDKVLMVKGYKSGAAWSFPRGKINQDETEAACAVREVQEEEEEEGAEKNPYYVETVIKDQKIRLYFLPGVREDEAFQTRTRGEISKIDWFRVTDLPTYSKKKVADGVKQPKFYMVTPFIS